MLRVTKTAVLLLVGAAIAAPSAGALPIDYPLQAASGSGHRPINADGQSSGTGAAEIGVTRTVEVNSRGFDWGDAGLGAAGTLSLLGLGAGVVVIARRSRPAVS
jgi:hypothetical protein